MAIELGLTEEQTVNTQHAGVAALSTIYQQDKRLDPLSLVDIGLKTVDYTPTDKLQQMWLSIMCGCQTISAMNTCLKPDLTLAQVWRHDQFSDQSNVARTLDKLTQMNIEELREAVTTIWRPHSQARAHDWRGYLWLDFDLSGLPCGKQAEAGSKGYFSGKKT
jgi:hypothetical protein